MYNPSIYESEQKVDLKKLIKLFKEAKSAVFTLGLSDGKSTIVGVYLKTESEIGVSKVSEMPSKKTVEVDHRAIRWMILKNVKYTVI